MTISETTCWTMIQGAAQGRSEDREQFAVRYVPVVKAYLEARWGRTPLVEQVEDTAQEVFLECFRDGGALAGADPARYGSFRQFLYGVVRNVALRVERKSRQAREQTAAPDFDFDAIERDEATLSGVFDRAWARSVVEDAVAIQFERALAQGEEAQRRVELLHLRFHEGLKIRDIARLWNIEPRAVHRAYARARREFTAALREVVEFHNPGSPEAAERELQEILALLA